MLDPFSISVFFCVCFRPLPWRASSTDNFTSKLYFSAHTPPRCPRPFPLWLRIYILTTGKQQKKKTSREKSQTNLTTANNKSCSPAPPGPLALSGTLPILFTTALPMANAPKKWPQGSASFAPPTRFTLHAPPMTTLGSHLLLFALPNKAFCSWQIFLSLSPSPRPPARSLPFTLCANTLTICVCQLLC